MQHLGLRRKRQTQEKGERGLARPWKEEHSVIMQDLVGLEQTPSTIDRIIKFGEEEKM